MNHWMFRCEDVSKKVSQSLDVPLPLHHSLAIWIHLMMCSYCSRFRRQIIWLRKTSRSNNAGWSAIDNQEVLSKEVKIKLKKKLRTLSLKTNNSN